MLLQPIDLSENPAKVLRALLERGGRTLDANSDHYLMRMEMWCGELVEVPRADSPVPDADTQEGKARD